MDQQVQSFKAVLLNMFQPDLDKLHILRLTTQSGREWVFLVIHLCFEQTTLLMMETQRAKRQIIGGENSQALSLLIT